MGAGSARSSAQRGVFGGCRPGRGARTISTWPSGGPYFGVISSGYAARAKFRQVFPPGNRQPLPLVGRGRWVTGGSSACSSRCRMGRPVTGGSGVPGGCSRRESAVLPMVGRRWLVPAPEARAAGRVRPGPARAAWAETVLRICVTGRCWSAPATAARAAGHVRFPLPTPSRIGFSSGAGATVPLPRARLLYLLRHVDVSAPLQQEPRDLHVSVL